MTPRGLLNDRCRRGLLMLLDVRVCAVASRRECRVRWLLEMIVVSVLLMLMLMLLLLLELVSLRGDGSAGPLPLGGDDRE